MIYFLSINWKISNETKKKKTENQLITVYELE